MHFVALHFPGAQIWTRDIDRLAPAALLEAIAQASCRSIDSVRSMTLATYLMGSGAIMHEHRWAATWVTSIGMKGRFRTSYGLQYCPRCLQANNAFLRTWRLAFAFACPTHRLILEDRCDACGAPVVPHRARYAPSRCHYCGSTLGNLACHDAAWLAEALRVQGRFIGFCGQDRIDINGSSIERTEFFWGLSVLMKILREKMRSHESEFEVQNRLVSGSREALRMSSVAVRLRLCSSVLDVLERWPDAFFRHAMALNMTQAAFSHCGTLPPWLRAQVSVLPRRMRPRYAYRRSTLLKRVRQVENEGGKDCRARRAHELMIAAGRWS